MATYSVIIRPIPPSGFRWNVVADGEVVRSGTTATEPEARVMAEAEVKELEHCASRSRFD